ncbi:MAG: hypothetical protein AB7N71_02655 [Phycisphaerae bacterium]
MNQQDQLEQYLNQRVVLDTQGPLVIIGTLEAIDERGLWLRDADVHDRSDGHATKEEYVGIAHQLERDGVRNINRKRVFVERGPIVCISALRDVVVDGEQEEDEGVDAT